MSISNSYHYPKPSEEGLKLQYVGKRLSELPTPAAVVDVAVVRRNCDAMLAAIEDIGNLEFRAHTKTHKTTELTELQVHGFDPKRNRDIRLVVSTVAEIEHLLPWLLQKKRDTPPGFDILYGVPASPSTLPRLAALAHIISPYQIHLLVDNADSVDIIANSEHLWPFTIPVFIKIDTGYHRAGVEPDSEAFWQVIRQLNRYKDKVCLAGLYSHLGNSYGGNSVDEAIKGLHTEIESLHEVGRLLLKDVATASKLVSLTYSVGATPTATAAQNLTGESRAAQDFRSSLSNMYEEFRNIDRKLTIELHAGVYPLLDLQQLATHARPSRIKFSVLSSEPEHNYQGLSYASIGLRILVEVASLYPHRDIAEALLAAGSLAFGREPCKSYSGWGVVTPWQESDPSASFIHLYDEGPRFYDPDQSESERSGWFVSRVSQEHGMLTWSGRREEMRKLKVGEKLLIWPNHACIVGAGFGWYFVVDSDCEEKDVVRDVWVRCRGW